MAVLLWPVGAFAEEAPPRAVIALFETAGFSLPQGPLPDGLRFVLYDDGQIITRSGPTQTNPDPPGRGVTYGILERDAAESLRLEVTEALKTVALPDSGIVAAAEVGSTILEVWDGAGYQRISASAWPCQTEGRVFKGGWKRNREATDPQFLKVCDRLMQYQIAAPQRFLPKSVKLMLGASANPPERILTWPAEWPPAPPDLKPKAAVAFCATVSDDPTSFSHGLITARWDGVGKIALVIDQSRSAVIWDWYFDLPAAIPLVSDEGEPGEPVGSDCS